VGRVDINTRAVVAQGVAPPTTPKARSARPYSGGALRRPPRSGRCAAHHARLAPLAHPRGLRPLGRRPPLFITSPELFMLSLPSQIILPKNKGRRGGEAPPNGRSPQRGGRRNALRIHALKHQLHRPIHMIQIDDAPVFIV